MPRTWDAVPDALESFQARLKREFHETVEWVDENTLVVL